MIGNSCAQLGQTNDRVVCGLQVGELLAQEVLHSGHIRQGEIVRRCDCLSSSKSQAEEEQPEKPCGQLHTLAWRLVERLIYLLSPRTENQNTFLLHTTSCRDTCSFIEIVLARSLQV